MDLPEPLSERMVALESLVTHLQYDVEKMNEAILDQQTQLGVLKRGLERLKDQLSDASSGADSDGLPQEKPPHY